MIDGMDAIGCWLITVLAGLVIGKRTPTVRTDDDRNDDFLRIRCPACRWQPGRQDLWVCDPECGCCWNTFATRGRCPACDKQWRETMCLRCAHWSPHDDWYER